MSAENSTPYTWGIDSNTRLLSFVQVCILLSVSRNFVYEEVARGALPKPLKLTPGRRGAARFIEAEILAYVAQKAAMREEQQHAL
jgi:predicted DNA-binding transcriptional regulator AlpA